MEPLAGTRLVVLPLRWHEAVALVREVADAVGSGRFDSVPAAADLRLLPDGSVQVAGGTRAGRAGHGAAGLQRLLAEVIEPAAPPELRALLEEEAGGRTLEDFVGALGYFERPGRQADLRALAGHLRQAEEERRLESEVERLVHRARAEEHPHPPPHTRSESMPVSRGHGAVRLAVAVLAVVAAVGALAIALLMALSDDPLRTTRTIAGQGAGLVTTLREAARSALRDSHAAPAVVAPDPARPPAATRRRLPRPRPNSAMRSRPVKAAVAPVEVFRAAEPEIVEVQLELSRLDPMPAPASLDAIYDRSTPGVSPARLLRPHLPTLPSERDDRGQLGLLEVLVDADGRVERVRLLATTAERRYHDAMLLAAVKAWIFRPARLRGEPVRYRLEIPLT